MKTLALLTALSAGLVLAQPQSITLDLASPLVETNVVSRVTVEIADIIGVARPYIDESGDFGRKVKAGDLRVYFAGYEPPQGFGTPLANIRDAMERELLITGAEMGESAAAIGITGTWAGGTNELKTTIHAIMRKVAEITGQPDAWADAYYSALVTQILSQLGQ